MKKIYFVFQIIVTIAIVILYYLHFADRKNQFKKAGSIAQKVRTTGSAQPLIAYVDLDSLNEKIGFVKANRKKLEAEQRSIESEWESGYRSLENQKNEFLKKGNSITEQMAQEFQSKLMQQQDRIDGRKQELSQQLSEKHFHFMEDFQKKLKGFLNEYNKERNFSYILTVGTGLDYMVYRDSAMDITADVVEGMNQLEGKD